MRIRLCPLNTPQTHKVYNTHTLDESFIRSESFLMALHPLYAKTPHYHWTAHRRHSSRISPTTTHAKNIHEKYRQKGYYKVSYKAGEIVAQGSGAFHNKHVHDGMRETKTEHVNVSTSSTLSPKACIYSCRDLHRRSQAIRATNSLHCVCTPIICRRPPNVADVAVVVATRTMFDGLAQQISFICSCPRRPHLSCRIRRCWLDGFEKFDASQCVRR